MRNRAVTLAVIAATGLVLAWQMAHLSKTHVLLGDFRAFYCGGRVVTHGGNPYAAAPIMACESTPQPFGLHRSPAGLAEPVPYPGYAFALFAPFALLPFVPAACAWVAFSVALLIAGSLMLARMMRLPPAAVLAVFAAGFSTAVWPYGEVSGVALVGLTLAAAAIRAKNVPAAVAGLCCAAILPHIAAPAFLALFVWERRARIPLLVACALLLALDAAVGGPALALSYFTQVLPAHAQSEIGYVTQYGLTWILHAAGLSNHLSVQLGEVSYAIMLAGGVWLGGMLAARFDDRAFSIFVPAGFAVIGGPFMHYSEIVLALPALMLLYARSEGVLRTVLGAAVILVAVPWQWTLQPALIVVFAAAAFGIALLFLKVEARIALRAALAAAIACGFIVFIGATYGAQLSSGASVHLDPHLAQSSWAEYIRTNSSSAGLVWACAKLPTWIGLCLLAFGCAYAVAKKDFVAAIAVKQVPIEF